MDDKQELVSVIIPAYNSQKTLGRTLASVSAQTYLNLEILVIDDGSKDDTANITEAAAIADPRIRLIRQANGGVAVARNKGVEEAKSEFIAPVDADDLWRPSKIERQMRALRAAGPEAGLVYCWSAYIDEEDKIISWGAHPQYIGDVFFQLLYGNFVGNGSSPIMRRELVLEAGGYDSSLHARKAQGCEDWKLYLLLAERSHFAVVPDHLVGYRQTVAAMSGDVSQMLRSDAIVRDEMLTRHPNNAVQLDTGRMSYLNWLLFRETENGNAANCKILVEKKSTFGGKTRKSLVSLGKDQLRMVRQRIRKRRTSRLEIPFLAEQKAGT